ncbi:hypothetical protein VB776_06915 [Arcicella sp. DC2W]|uniref:His-Xaa-Ser system protein HxsD n=1 Tax=Arcicella gelida TaxID=2984195 RepID=A0ABU5S2H3_9BACT|nr:hypothetical protein [Arcicella sp. DC2W]MEA5402638.1 hypothetical protein [Arcicella sp. DC2W]
MFGFDLENFKAKLDVVETTLAESTFEFTVDDVLIIVSHNKVTYLNWKIEPTPDELMAAINEAFELLSEQIKEKRETSVKELLSSVPEPVKSILERQYNTLAN